jgi:hypothetical protein
VSLGYGVVVIFFVGFMGSMVVYLAKWGVSQGNFIESREPSFLFVYAPESFGWRTLLLEGARTEKGDYVVQNGKIDPKLYSENKDNLGWAKLTGAFLVSVWLYVFFLLVLGFSYSYFWSSSTIIYLLMRRKVDDTDLDEVYLEDEETEEAYSSSAMPPVTATPPSAAPSPGMTMVEAPTLRSSAPPAPSTPAAAPPSRPESPPPTAPEPTATVRSEPATAAARTESTTSASGDGNPPASSEKT